LSRKSAY